MKGKSSAKQKNYLPKTESELDVFLEKSLTISGCNCEDTFSFYFLEFGMTGIKKAGGDLPPQFTS